MWVIEKRICKGCGQPFFAEHHREVYCSQECKKNTYKNKFKQIRKEHRLSHIRKCAICGKKFTPKNKKHIYCSFECSNTAHNSQTMLYKKKLKMKEQILIKNTEKCKDSLYAERVNRVLALCRDYDFIRECPILSKSIIFRGFLSEIEEKIKKNIPYDKDIIIADYINMCNYAETRKDIRLNPLCRIKK